MTEKSKGVVTTIFLPEKFRALLQEQAKHDGLSMNKRILTLLLIGMEAENQKQRSHDRTFREITKLSQEEYRRQSVDEYIKSDRQVPLNRYEVEKQRELQERAEPEPTPEPYEDDWTRLYGQPKRKPNNQREQPDEYGKIYDVNEKQERLEDLVERYKQSHWLPDSYYDRFYDEEFNEK